MTDIVPNDIAAGLTFTARTIDSRFTGVAWSLVLLLRGPSSADIIADREQGAHVWTVSAEDTGAWAPGVYAYSLRATDGEQVHEIESGTRTIRPNLADASAGHDGRSQNRIALDAIDAVIGKRATLDQQRYKIGNRELDRMTVADLLLLRTHYVREVAKEDRRRRGGKLFGRQLKVHMGKGC